MTAEVAILNSGAIALAADSAVTIGDQKIYNSALKLFALSKTAPVGTMIYGNAGLMNIPWESLIKSFRQNIKTKTFKKLDQYGVEFIKYLNKNPNNIFSEDSQLYWLSGNVSGYYTLIRDELFEEIHPILKEKGEVEAETINTLVNNVVKKHHQILQQKEFAEGFDIQTFKSIRTKHKNRFKEIKEQVFEKIKISSALAAKLYDIAKYIHVKQIFSTGVSGLVIAGFGESELFPSIVTYEIEGVIEDRLKYIINEKKSHRIKGGLECRIVAFAQEDMVANFMNGINPSIQALLEGYLTQLFERLPELLSVDKVEPNERKEFKNKTSKLLKEFLKQFNTHIRDEHIAPVLRMVMVLPKDELAAMAEAFVNLTAFKRRMTESMETVGGPIDVAVISKGDGLVWVKRKHYFPAELNQHFFKNYFRGISNDNN